MMVAVALVEAPVLAMMVRSPRSWRPVLIQISSVRDASGGLRDGHARPDPSRDLITTLACGYGERARRDSNPQPSDP
jgi:hypothetical protein